LILPVALANLPVPPAISDEQFPHNTATTFGSLVAEGIKTASFGRIVSPELVTR